MSDVTTVQAALDHAVSWIKERGVADKVLTLSWYGGRNVQVHIFEMSDLRTLLAGTGATLVREIHGTYLHITAVHDGLTFSACYLGKIGDVAGSEVL